jgi:membrane protein DedA with SNARE-associated domain
MFEYILSSVSSLSPLWIYTVLLIIPFVENIFPPSPSDTIVIVCASLIPLGRIQFIPALILTTIGSEIGFMILYYLGSQVDRKVMHSGKYKFLSKEGLIKAEEWYSKYGCGILIINRFLPGIRPVLAFFAGLSELEIKKTVLYSTLSAILWNALTLYLGIVFGNNVERIDRFLSEYSRISVIVFSVVTAAFLIRYLYKKIKSKKIEN